VKVEEPALPGVVPDGDDGDDVASALPAELPVPPQPVITSVVRSTEPAQPPKRTSENFPLPRPRIMKIPRVSSCVVGHAMTSFWAIS
jgi:hypothetical protein